MNLSILIERIGYIRSRANLSARKLSLLIGKNAGYIHMLEQNRNFAPTFETLMAILEVCNTPVEEFFYYNIEAYKQDQQIIEKLSEIKNKEVKDALLTVISRCK